MREHLYSGIPLVLGALLLVMGRILNDLPLTILSMFLVLWGIAIHANNIKHFRQESDHELSPFRGK